MLNTASSEDLGEEKAVLHLVGTTQVLHQHSMATPSIFNTASSEVEVEHVQDFQFWCLAL